ncbi:MAG: HPr family phosphocarrier protein [Lachnospiraceae bacterium]|nr:HPr family phosphocarrier protein [Lachnospiraceae bacterium]
MISKRIEIKLPEGLEARPIALLVQVASQYESSVYVECEDKKVNAKSIMGMMSLALPSGREIVVTVNGTDEERALENIEKYLCGE